MRRRRRAQAVYRVRYEGYGPGDSAVMVDCLTEDPDRTASAVRGAFLSHGGHPGAPGSVAYLFNEVGRLEYPPGARLGRRLDLAWQAGAEDAIVRGDGSVEVLTDPTELETVRSSLARAGCEAAAGEVTCRASLTAELSGAAAAEMTGLLRALGSLKGVRSVYTNAEVAGELLAGV